MQLVAAKVLPIGHGHAGGIGADGILKLTEHLALAGAGEVNELIRSVFALEAGHSGTQIGDKAAPLLAGGGIQQGGLLNRHSVIGIGVDLQPVRRSGSVPVGNCHRKDGGMVVPVDHGAVPLLYLHGGILGEVVVFLVGHGVTGGIDAERQPVARRNAGVGVFGHGQLFAGGKVKDPDIARRMIVDGGISKARRGRQDQQTAGKGGVIRGLQRKHFRTGLVEQAAAPPAGGGVVRPLAEVVVRLAGDAVRQQVGSLCKRGLAQHRVPAEDGIAARCIVAV